MHKNILLRRQVEGDSDDVVIVVSTVKMPTELSLSSRVLPLYVLPLGRLSEDPFSFFIQCLILILPVIIIRENLITSNGELGVSPTRVPFGTSASAGLGISSSAGCCAVRIGYSSLG